MTVITDHDPGDEHVEKKPWPFYESAAPFEMPANDDLSILLFDRVGGKVTASWSYENEAVKLTPIFGSGWHTATAAIDQSSGSFGLVCLRCNETRTAATWDEAMRMTCPGCQRRSDDADARPLEISCRFCGAPVNAQCTTARYEDYRDYRYGDTREAHPQRVSDWRRAQRGLGPRD